MFFDCIEDRKFHVLILMLERHKDINWFSIMRCRRDYCASTAIDKIREDYSRGFVYGLDMVNWVNKWKRLGFCIGKIPRFNRAQIDEENLRYFRI